MGGNLRPPHGNQLNKGLFMDSVMKKEIIDFLDKQDMDLRLMWQRATIRYHGDQSFLDTSPRWRQYSIDIALLKKSILKL